MNWNTPEGDCYGCWGSILHHLMTFPGEPILPRPDYCQDAAFVAYVLDQRLITCQHAGEIIRGERDV